MHLMFLYALVLVFDRQFEVPLLELVLKWGSDCAVVNLVELSNTSQSNIVHDNIRHTRHQRRRCDIDGFDQELHKYFHEADHESNGHFLELVRVLFYVNEPLESFS